MAIGDYIQPRGGATANPYYSGVQPTISNPALTDPNAGGAGQSRAGDMSPSSLATAAANYSPNPYTPGNTEMAHGSALPPAFFSTVPPTQPAVPSLSGPAPMDKAAYDPNNPFYKYNPYNPFDNPSLAGYRITLPTQNAAPAAPTPLLAPRSPATILNEMQYTPLAPGVVPTAAPSLSSASHTLADLAQAGIGMGAGAVAGTLGAIGTAGRALVGQTPYVGSDIQNPGFDFAAQQAAHAQALLGLGNGGPMSTAAAKGVQASAANPANAQAAVAPSATPVAPGLAPGQTQAMKDLGVPATGAQPSQPQGAQAQPAAQANPPAGQPGHVPTLGEDPYAANNNLILHPIGGSSYSAAQGSGRPWGDQALGNVPGYHTSGPLAGVMTGVGPGGVPSYTGGPSSGAVPGAAGQAASYPGINIADHYQPDVNLQKAEIVDAMDEPGVTGFAKAMEISGQNPYLNALAQQLYNQKQMQIAMNEHRVEPGQSIFEMLNNQRLSELYARSYAQSLVGAQGAAGTLANTGLAGQTQIGVEGLRGQAQMGTAGIAGQAGVQEAQARNQGMLGNTALQGQNEQQLSAQNFGQAMQMPQNQMIQARIQALQQYSAAAQSMDPAVRAMLPAMALAAGIPLQLRQETTLEQQPSGQKTMVSRPASVLDTGTGTGNTVAAQKTYNQANIDYYSKQFGISPAAAEQLFKDQGYSKQL